VIETMTLPDGGTLAYQVSGRAAPPILLIRPLAGGMRAWGRFREELAAHARVIAFDQRGVGASSAAPRRASTRGMAGDALALADHLGLERFDVFGISLGGMVASWLAIDAPARVRHLVLASTLPRGAAVGLVHSAHGLVRGLGLARCLAGDAHAAARCLAGRVLSPQFKAEHPERAAQIEEVIAADGVPRRTIFAFLRAGAAHDVRAHLPAIVAPTLVVCGGHDPLITVDSQRRLLAGLPDATFDVIPGAGHAIDSEQPVTLAARALAFCLGAR